MSSVPLTSNLQTSIQNAAFAMRLLPIDACPVMIFVTDGVVSLSSGLSKQNKKYKHKQKYKQTHL